MSGSDEFNQWNEIKKRLQSAPPRYAKIGKIYWLSVGKNIGSEIYGKGAEFKRPVLAIKLLSRTSFLGVPLTSKIKNGRYCFYFVDSKGAKQTALLNQIKTFDTRRITQPFKANIAKGDFLKVKDLLVEILKE